MYKNDIKWDDIQLPQQEEKQVKKKKKLSTKPQSIQNLNPSWSSVLFPFLVNKSKTIFFKASYHNQHTQSES